MTPGTTDWLLVEVRLSAMKRAASGEPDSLGPGRHGKILIQQGEADDAVPADVAIDDFEIVELLPPGK